MYRRILIPTDGSQLAAQAVPYARLMAQAFGAEIEILTVHDQRQPGPDVSREVEPLVQDLRREQLTVQTTFGSGDPAEAIAQAADRVEATLVTVATHGRSGVGRWWFGSVTDSVIRTARCPILVIRPKGEEEVSSTVHLRTVIMPLDGSQEGETIIPHVVTLAKALLSRIVVLRSVSSPNILAAEHRAAQSRDPAPERTKAEAYLQGIADRLKNMGVEEVEQVIPSDDPATNIIGASQRFEDSVIVMNTHARGGVQRAVLGSVADKVVRESAKPVLLIRP